MGRIKPQGPDFKFYIRFYHQKPRFCLNIQSLKNVQSVDKVHGFPHTEEGFKGKLVITEYLTKFPYVVPIESKQATEIAWHSFNYIYTFQPSIDQGTEFVNENKSIS